MSPRSSAPIGAPLAGTTQDAVLDGRVRLRQPLHGHRVGHDAILLAAATGAKTGEHAVELGSGVGAAGLALAFRVPHLAVTLVEIDADQAGLAQENIRANAFGDRVRAIVLDVGAPASAFAVAGLEPGSAQRVLMNPPFNDPVRHQRSPDAGRRLAHAAPAHGLPVWVRCASRLLGRRGVLTLIWRADGLASVLAALSGGFGGIVVLPVHPRSDRPAVRILIHAVKASRAALTLLPSFALCDEAGVPTRAADAVLRGAATLPLADS